MTDPKIKVGADVGGVTAGIQRVGAAADQANKQAQRSLAQARKELQGYTGDVEKARRAFEALQKSGARGTRNLRGQTFESYTGGGWQGTSVNDAEARRMHRDVMHRVGLTPNGGGRGGQSALGALGALGFGGHSLFAAGRGILNSAFPVGGVGANIIQGGYHAARQSSGGLWSGGGMSRIGMGLGIGAAAFGAVRAIGAVGGKIGQAEDEASHYADLVRQVGAVSSEFTTLRDSIRQATAGMGITYNEAAKLGAVYAKEAGIGSKSRAGLAGEVGAAAGFARGMGLDPETGVRFFGAMRHNRVTTGDADNRKLAAQIGDAVAEKGEFSRAGELIDAVHGFVSTVAARAMASANVGGFLGMSSKLGGLGLPGLGLSESAGLAGRMDAGFRNPGGGEAGQNLLLSMLQRVSPDATAMDLAAVQAGGYFGRGSDVFGRGSPQYAAAKAMKNNAEMARQDRLSKAFGGTTLGDHLTGSLLGHYGGNTQAAISAMSGFFGGSASDSAAQIAAFMSPGGSGKLSGHLSRLGLDTAKINPSNYGLLGALSGGDRHALEAQAKDLLARTGDSGLTQDEKARLNASLTGETDGLRDTVMTLSASRSHRSEGDLSRETIAGLGNVFQAFADKAIPLLTTLRDVAIKTGEFTGVFKKGTLDATRSAEAQTQLQARLSLAGSPGDKYQVLGSELARAQADGMPSSYIESVASQIRGLSSQAPARAGTGGGTGFRSIAGGGGLLLRAQRKTQYDAMFSAAAMKHGVPVEVLRAIAAKESNFNPQATHLNANGTTDMGLMQHNSAFMAERGLTSANVMDPQTNIDAGAALLRRLYARHGNWSDAMRAYNGSGPDANVYRDTVYPVAAQMAAEAGTTLDGRVPGGGPVGNPGRTHQTATITLLDRDGRAAAAPLPLTFTSEPQPAGMRR